MSPGGLAPEPARLSHCRGRPPNTDLGLKVFWVDVKQEQRELRDKERAVE